MAMHMKHDISHHDIISGSIYLSAALIYYFLKPFIYGRFSVLTSVQNNTVLTHDIYFRAAI